MPIQITENHENRFDVWQAGLLIGQVECYENPYHARNCYLRLQLNHFDPAISPALFATLARLIGRPLQVMTDSTNHQLAHFLKAGGFRCLRRCYESEVTSEDLLDQAYQKVPLSIACAPETAYQGCCRMLYAAYQQSHQAINPWTGGEDCFYRLLPKQVLLHRQGERIIHFAFIEDNEIAYVGGQDRKSFPAFAASLVSHLFESHRQICFESDDVDWPAMQLRALFRQRDDTSHDSYLYPLPKGAIAEPGQFL